MTDRSATASPGAAETYESVNASNPVVIGNRVLISAFVWHRRGNARGPTGRHPGERCGPRNSAPIGAPLSRAVTTFTQSTAGTSAPPRSSASRQPPAKSSGARCRSGRIASTTRPADATLRCEFSGAPSFTADGDVLCLGEFRAFIVARPAAVRLSRDQPHLAVSGTADVGHHRSSAAACCMSARMSRGWTMAVNDNCAATTCAPLDA